MMLANKSRAFSVIVTCIIIVLIIYLFASVQQPYVTCSKSITNDLGIRVVEELGTSIEGKKINKMRLTKIIVFPAKYIKDDKYINDLKYMLSKHYEYLGKNKVSYSVMDDRVIAEIEVSDTEEALVLNNIKFYENKELEIFVNSNTRSSDVVTLRIGDKYSEGQFMTKMKKSGYVCN